MSNFPETMMLQWLQDASMDHNNVGEAGLGAQGPAQERMQTDPMPQMYPPGIGHTPLTADSTTKKVNGMRMPVVPVPPPGFQYNPDPETVQFMVPRPGTPMPSAAYLPLPQPQGQDESMAWEEPEVAGGAPAGREQEEERAAFGGGGWRTPGVRAFPQGSAAQQAEDYAEAVLPTEFSHMSV